MKDDPDIDGNPAPVRVDFYLLARDPVEAVLPRIARAVRAAGERFLVVSDSPEQRAALDRALWEQLPEDFLAHGSGDDPHAARQPILLSGECAATNGARHVAFADGRWRDEGLGFERAFLFFDQTTIDDARRVWRAVGEHEGAERHFWKQDGGRWVEGP